MTVHKKLPSHYTFHEKMQICFIFYGIKRIVLKMALFFFLKRITVKMKSKKNNTVVVFF